MGLEDDGAQLLELLGKHDILLAAAALADARPMRTEAFEKAAGKIIAEHKRIVEEDSRRRQEAAGVLDVWKSFQNLSWNLPLTGHGQDKTNRRAMGQDPCASTGAGSKPQRGTSQDPRPTVL